MRTDERFRAAYSALGRRMKALAEAEGDVFLPNPEPQGPVEYNKLDAIVYKTVERQPPLIKDGINPPYVRGTNFVSTLNTYLIYAAAMTVPSGFTTDDLPVGITFFGRPYSEPILITLAYAYEQVPRHRRPPRTTPALARGATF